MFSFKNSIQRMALKAQTFLVKKARLLQIGKSHVRPCHASPFNQNRLKYGYLSSSSIIYNYKIRKMREPGPKREQHYKDNNYSINPYLSLSF